MCSMRLLIAILAAALSSVAMAGCGPPPAAPVRSSDAEIAGRSEREWSLPGFDKRNYILFTPSSYEPGTPIPLVIALHGGGGHNDSANNVTCFEGKGCLTDAAEREGFAVVFPDGFPGDFLEDVRTWNAGGGANGFQCVSGLSCKNGIDDMAFLDALHEELLAVLNVDEDRVYATGLSNGGAMAHRLACERSTRFAAIAPVGAGNQLAAVQGCNIARPVPVLEIHGTADPCWTFEQSAQACAQDDGEIKVGVAETVAGWAERNGCAGDVVTEPLADTVEDGMSTTRESHTGCVDGADVVLLRVENGGHTWPNGDPYASENQVGGVTRDFDADDEILAFFAAHPRARADD